MQYWLIKSEPDVWSLTQQEKAGVKGAIWDGVRNYQARNNLKKMKNGDLCFFYHSNIGKEIVGIVEVIKEGIVEKIGFRSTTIRKFDKSLAIIPNFQFAENAVINISQTTNWLISWTITLQYDTTIEQLKNVRDQIENFIKESEDFDTKVGLAVRVDKFSDSSIDMYVRCFSQTDSWNEWLKVKERLALGIKEIVEKNKASFAFPSQSIYVEKK